MPDLSTNNIIPTSANIFETVVDQYKDLNSSIKYFSNKGIKNSDILKIKGSIRRSKKAVSILIEGYKEVTAYIDKEANQTKNIVSSIVSDPVLFIKSIKDKKSFIEVKQQNELFLLDSYIAIFKLLQSISDFGNSIKLKNIRKLPKVTRSAMSAIVSSLKIIGRRAKFLKPIAKASEVTIAGLTNVFNSLLTMQGMLVNFGSQALSVGKMMKIRWGIKQLFLSFVFVLAEMYQLGKFIKTGEYDDESLTNFKILKTTKKRKISFEKQDLLATLAIGAGIMVGVTLVLTLMSVMLSQMKTIGTLKTKILLKATLRNMNTLLFGWDKETDPEGDDSKGKKNFHNNGVLDMMHKIGGDKSVIFEALNFAVVCASLTVGILAMGIVVKQLRKIWINSVFLKPSLRTFYTLFFGADSKGFGIPYWPGKKWQITDPKHTPGLFETLSKAGTDENFGTVFSFMFMSFMLGASMFTVKKLVIPTVTSLGFRRLAINRGLKTLDILINGIPHDGKENGRKGLLTIMRLATYGDKGKLNRKAVGAFMWMSFKLGAAMFVLQNTLIPALSLMAIAGIPMILGTRFLNIVLLGGEDPFGNEIPGIIDIITDKRLQEEGILKGGLRLIAICGIFLFAGLMVSAMALFAPILPMAAFSILVINFLIKRILKIFDRILEYEDEKINKAISLLPKLMIPYTTVLGLLKVAKDITFKDIGLSLLLAAVAPFITKGMIQVVRVSAKMGNTEVGVSKLAVAAPAYTAFLGLLNKAGEVYNETNFENAHKMVKSSQPVIWSMVRVFRRMGRRLGFKSIMMGSISLDLMATSLISFSGSVAIMSKLIAGIDLKSIKRFVGLVAGMAALLIVIGLASPIILVGVTALLAVSAAIIVFAAAILVLNIAILAFAGVLIVFALAFSLLAKILPGDDIINAVVNGTIKLVIAISRISMAIYTNISLKQVLFGVLALLAIDIILLELVISGVLFKVAADIVKDITEEQTESILKFIDCLSDIVHGIYEKVNGKELIIAILSCIGYLIVMSILLVVVIETLIIYALVSIINFQTFERQMGINNDSGLIPSLGAIVEGIDKSINAVSTIKAVLKIGGIMILIGMLNAVALAIKTLSSMEITEFDENGKKTGNKVQMKASDFKNAANNATEMIKAIVGIFYDEKGNETDIVKLLGTIDKSMKKQLKNIQAVVNTISKIAKIISKMSKLVVPDPDKGFDKDGKALGWVKMSSKDITEFKDNTLLLVSALFDIFDDSTPGSSGKKLQKVLDTVKISMTVKMSVIRSVISCISGITDVIVKMSTSLVPDTSSGKDDWYDPETGKIIKWRQLNLKNEIEPAKDKIAAIMTSFGAIVQGIKDTDMQKMKKRALKKTNMLLSMISPINSLIDTIISLGTGRFPIMQIDPETGEALVDSEGNPKMRYITFNDIPIEDAMTNIETILIQYLAKVGTIFKKGFYKKRIKAINKAMKNGVAIEGITDLIENIIKLGTGQFPIMILDETTGEPLKDKDGNIRMRYVRIGSEEITRATDNIGLIVKSYIDKLTEIIGTGVNAIQFKQKMTNIKDVFTGSSSIFSLITPMIENIESINKIGEKNISIFRTNLQNIIYGYNDGIISLTNMVGEYAIYDQLVKDIFKDFVNTTSNLYGEMKDNNIPLNVGRTIASTNNFLTQLNSTNSQKLGKMADISQNMATFATKINGNFDGLAKAMNENIITALDKVDKALTELKETLSTLPDDVGSAVKNGIPNEIKITDSNPPKPNGPVKDASQTKEVAPSGKPQDDNRKDRNLYNLIDELMSCIEGQKSIRTRNVK